MDSNKLRTWLASEGAIEATDSAGNLYTGNEASAYYEGRNQAIIATNILRRSGLLLPNLEGFHETQDLEFKQGLHDIADSLGVEPKIVYNPGCGSHVSLARAFPEARTILVDNFAGNSPEIGDELLAQGFELYQEDMHEFTLPDGLKADITLILNAGHMTEEELDRVVAENGIVLINEWHGGATYMRENCPRYKLVDGVQSSQNVYSAEGSRNDANTLYVFQRQEKRQSSSMASLRNILQQAKTALKNGEKRS